MSSESSGLKHTAVGSFIVIVKQSALLRIWTAHLGLRFNRRRSVYAVDMAVHHRRITQQRFLPQLASAWADAKWRLHCRRGWNNCVPRNQKVNFTAVKK